MIYTVSDRETISSVSSVAGVGFTSTKLVTGIVYAIIQAIVGNVRITVDGSTPSTSLGLKLIQNSHIEVWGKQAMSDFLCIDDGGSAKLEVVYMKVG